MNRGYSVFEVLVAFAIMAMVLAALLPGQAKLLAHAKSSEEKALAHDYALSRLARLGVSEPVSTGEQSFEFAEWIVVERTTPIDESGDLVEVTVMIADGAGVTLAKATSIRTVAP